MKEQIIKKIIIMVIMMLFSNTFFGQAAFDKFDGQDDVSSVIINKKMFDLMSKVKMDASNKEVQQYFNLIKKLDYLKVFTTKSSRVEKEMKAASDQYSKAAGLEEMMRINENGKNIQIMVKSGSNESEIKELLMFIAGTKNEDTVLMSIIGTFNLDEIAVLVDKMRIPGGDDLKKASKNKK